MSPGYLTNLPKPIYSRSLLRSSVLQDPYHEGQKNITRHGGRVAAIDTSAGEKKVMSQTVPRTRTARGPG